MKKHQQAKTAEVVRFAGLDASAPHGDGGIAYDIRNFKILPDGSLERRCGFGLLATLGDEIRAVRVIHDTAGEFLLAVAGASLYRISAADGSFTSKAVLGTTRGRVIFFEFGGDLYLMDGAEIYRYAGGVSVSPCVGYIPLYGEGWSEQNAVQPIKEPINLFSPKIRVSYVVEAPTAVVRLNLNMKLRSVDRVTVDGVRITNHQVQAISEGENYAIVFPEEIFVGKMEVCVTLEDSYWHDALIRSCDGVTVYDGFSAPRVFLYGGDGGALYASLPVNEASLAASLACDATATALYFPKGHEACFGSGSPVTAVGRVGERVMICTAGSAWMTDDMAALEDTMADKMTVRRLSQTVGCVTRGGFGMLDGEVPVTVSAGGIYRWKIDRETAWESTVENISRGFELHAEDGFFRGAETCYVSADDQLWFYLPGGAEGRIFIYNGSQDLWFSYEGIHADLIVDSQGGAIFVDGADIYRFDRGRENDGLPYGEREIVGHYESRRMDFGNGEAKKRAARVFVEADIAEGELTVGLCDGVLLDEVLLVGGNGADCYGAPVATSRFRRLSVVLRARGPHRQRIYGFCIHSGR